MSNLGSSLTIRTPLLLVGLRRPGATSTKSAKATKNTRSEFMFVGRYCSIRKKNKNKSSVGECSCTTNYSGGPEVKFFLGQKEVESEKLVFRFVLFESPKREEEKKFGIVVVKTKGLFVNRSTTNKGAFVG